MTNRMLAELPRIRFKEVSCPNLNPLCASATNMSRRASLHTVSSIRRQCLDAPIPYRLPYLQSRRYASSEEKPEFKAQLWESTATRVQKERAEQARWSTSRSTGGSAVASAFGFTAGILPPSYDPTDCAHHIATQHYSSPPATATT